MNVQEVVYYSHCFYVELRTGQLRPSLSVMAHAVQANLAWEADQPDLDVNEFVSAFFNMIKASTTIMKSWISL